MELNKAYTRRCREVGGMMGEEAEKAMLARGVLRVDYLGGEFWFEGLVRGRGGVWEMKMSKGRRGP